MNIAAIIAVLLWFAFVALLASFNPFLGFLVLVPLLGYMNR